MNLPYRAKGWKTAPISPVCEQLAGSLSGKATPCCSPTDFAYPAMGGGWMALCGFHGRKHRAFPIADLIKSGEVFKGAPMHETEVLVFCECGHAISEDDLCAGYTNLLTNKPICEVCWQRGIDDQL